MATATLAQKHLHRFSLMPVDYIRASLVDLQEADIGRAYCNLQMTVIAGRNRKPACSSNYSERLPIQGAADSKAAGSELFHS